MASIVIAGDTSGSVTISAPAIAGTPTLTLPTTSGTLVVTGGAQTIEFAAGSAASPSITFTGDTNTGIFSPTADTVGFTTGGSERMRIASGGSVGIGTSSPSSLLHVSSSGSPAIRVASTAGSGGVCIITAQSTGNSQFDSGNDYVFSIGPEQVRFSATGGVTLQKNLSVGGATPTTSGTGITFPATQSASSDANTLDDYEEGTWTPTASAQSGSLTSYTSSGQYTKVGRMVYVIGRIALTNVGTASGQLFCGGLPFSTLNTASRPSIPLCREDAVTGVVYGGYVDPSSTSFTITSLTFGSIVWTNNYVYSFCFTYQASN